jgi:hypothetical protein
MSQKQEKPKGFQQIGGGGGDGPSGGDGQQQREAAKKALAKSADVLNTNHIVYGANDVNIDLNGYSIAQIEEALAEVLNMEPGTTECYVEGKLVGDKMNFTLAQGQRVEFMKESGQKGIKSLI